MTPPFMSGRAATRQRLTARRAFAMLACASLSAVSLRPLLAADATARSANPASYWIQAGQGGIAAERSRYKDAAGQVEVLYAHGPLDLAGNAFFEPLGTNGRACVTCHQPSSGMGLSLATIRKRWEDSHGKDPLFAAIDGSNCPSLPQDLESSHSLLLTRGLFRVALPWPRTRAPDGTPIDPGVHDRGGS